MIRPHWKPPGAQEWSNHFTSKKNIPRIKGVPMPQKKTYLYPTELTIYGTISGRIPTAKSARKSIVHSGDFPGATTPITAKNKYFSTLGMASPVKGDGGGLYGSMKSGSFSAAAFGEHRPRTAQTSWTLKVSRLDILKLRHELDVEQIRGNLESFARKVDLSRLGSTKEGF